MVSHELYALFVSKKILLTWYIDWIDVATLFVSNFLFIFIFHYFHLYKLNVFLTRSRQTVVIVKSMVYGLFFIVIASFFLKLPLITDSRLLIAIFFHVAIILLFVTRVLFLYPFYVKVLAKKIFRTRILILGAGRSGQYFAQKIMFENVYGAEIAGFVDDFVEKGTVVYSGIKVLGTSKDLVSLMDSYKFDEIVICINKIEYDRLLLLIDKCKKLNVSVKVTSDLFGIIPEKIFSEHYENIPVLDVSTKINLGVYNIVKRVVDYICAGLGIILLSPFYLIVGLIIKVTSRGPVVYKQVRIGKDGKSFNFYKFRSMNVISGKDVEREKKMIEFMKNGNGHGAEKIVNKARITPIGKFLRKYSLDEMPQLFNVLKGDMSLVGPRPCLPYEYGNYDEWQKRRQSVLPGCTGLWQVSGRSNVNFNDSVIMDLYYISNVTPWLDMQLIFKTVPVMVFARGGK
ncbi:MAG: sugar transferase [Ignavibacteriae bacterium]|nr:sugar transferase [Ignavibacteriota bacterium]